MAALPPDPVRPRPASAEDKVFSLHAEIGQLRAGIYQSVLALKMLYMEAGLGQKTGLDALAALSAEIKALDQLLIVHR